MDVFIHFHESMFFFVFICSGLSCDFYCVVLIRDCREMLKIVFDFPNELIDKVIEIS